MRGTTTFIGIIGLVLLITACGGSNAPSGTTGTVVTGTVQAPAGQLAQSGPTITQWFASLLTGTESYALDVTGWTGVANATVRAFLINDDGTPLGPVLAMATTNDIGFFTLTFPNNQPLTSNLIVQVQIAGPAITGPVDVGTPNTFSAPVVFTTTDLNPAIEAAIRPLIQRPEPLSSFSNQKVIEFLDSVSKLVAQAPPPPGSVETVITNIAQTQAPAITSGLDAIATPGVAPLTILTTSLPNAVVQSPYALSLAAVGGAGAKTWGVVFSDVSPGLPAGLTWNATTGVISGTPTTPGQFTFMVHVQDSANPPQQATKDLSITVTAGTVGGGAPAPQSSFTALPSSLTSRRAGHTATLLQDGKVLITGGFSSSTFPAPALNTAELYDPAAKTFTALTGTMRSARTHHTATLLPNGQVLLTGGQVDTNNGDGNNSAELYDPATQTFTAIAATMTSPRGGHVAVLLPNGQVLLAGGFNNEPVALNSAELYNPTTQIFTAIVATMASRRESPTATRLPDGRVLLTGGSSSRTTVNTAEIFEPSTQSFTAIGTTMSSARHGHGATALASGSPLITGGGTVGATPPSSTTVLDTAELFNPTTQAFSAISARLTVPRIVHAQTTLANGSVLLTGGLNINSGSFVVLNSAEVFTP